VFKDPEKGQSTLQKVAEEAKKVWPSTGEPRMAIPAHLVQSGPAPPKEWTDAHPVMSVTVTNALSKLSKAERKKLDDHLASLTLAREEKLVKQGDAIHKILKRIREQPRRGCIFKTSDAFRSNADVPSGYVKIIRRHPVGKNGDVLETTNFRISCDRGFETWTPITSGMLINNLLLEGPKDLRKLELVTGHEEQVQQLRRGRKKRPIIVKNKETGSDWGLALEPGFGFYKSTVTYGKTQFDPKDPMGPKVPGKRTFPKWEHISQADLLTKFKDGILGV